MAKPNVLEINKIYILESTKTNHPYITPDGACLVFPHEADAKAAHEATPDTRLGAPNFYKMDDLCYLCYAAGANAVRIQIKDKIEELVLHKEFANHAPCGHELNRTIAKVKHTKTRQALSGFAFCEYIVPVKVREEGEIKITYAVVKHQVKDLGMLYIAFSSLDEFTIWQSEHPEWSPIKVSFAGLRRIGGKSGVMINPSGNRMILTANMLAEVGKILDTNRSGLDNKDPEKSQEEIKS